MNQIDTVYEQFTAKRNGSDSLQAISLFHLVKEQLRPKFGLSDH